MSVDQSIMSHYEHGALTNHIEKAILAMGKTKETITIADLAPVDEFHIGGRTATDHLIMQLNLPQNGHILDVGCGLGGAARYVAQTYQTKVTGIDLTPEYIETGNEMSRWLGLEKAVQLDVGSALSMPYPNKAFDAAYMLHVGMNIADKAGLFTEIARTLQTGGALGIYDLMRKKDGEINFPLPWASEPKSNYLGSINEYQTALKEAGFEIIKVTDRRDFALHFIDKLRARVAGNSTPPPLGPHTLMQATVGDKLKNLFGHITENEIVPIEIVAVKR